MVKKRIYDIIIFNKILTKLYEQEINYPINISYMLYKLKNELDEIENFIFLRWENLFGENFNIENFTDNEMLLYNTTLDIEIDVDLFNLSLNDITNNDKVKITIQEIQIIDNFLK